MSDLIQDPLEALAFTEEIINSLPPSKVWVIPQSGGKDSRLAGQAPLVLIEEGRVKQPPEKIVFYMADTLMEFWTFKDQAIKAMKQMTNKAQSLGLEAEWFVTHPLPQRDFWVKILGYGHIPPTPNMRWCTDNLKIAEPMKMLRKMGLMEAPKFLGVRYGESERRDKILSCTVGGECGPDTLWHKLRSHKDKRIKESLVQPIVRWRQCAVWDFLTLIAPSYGFDNAGLVDHYGPDGTLRYGCWSCPLIFNDRTAHYLKDRNPILHELIVWTDANLRRGGQAWKPQNRELFRSDGDIKDGLLSLDYCRRLYGELLSMSRRHGVELLTRWQREAIKAVWGWRETLPAAQAAHGGQESMGLALAEPEAKLVHITSIPYKLADTLAGTRLCEDGYHRAIQQAAQVLIRNHYGQVWEYGGQFSGGITWWRSLEDETLQATVVDRQVEIERF